MVSNPSTLTASNATEAAAFRKHHQKELRLHRKWIREGRVTVTVSTDVTFVTFEEYNELWMRLQQRNVRPTHNEALAWNGYTNIIVDGVVYMLKPTPH